MASPPPVGHNGAPTYETRSDLPDDILPLDWFKCKPKDALDDMMKLPLDERGFYASAWLAMYADMEMLPADDRMAAHRLAMDVRSYRAYLNKLLEKRSETSGLPLLYRRPSGRISNHRYEKEITEYVEGAKKRREVAVEREARRKAAKQAAPLKHQNADTSAVDVRGMSGGSGDILGTLNGECTDNQTSIDHRSSEKKQQKQQQDNHGAATALPEARQASATDIDVELEREKKKQASSVVATAAAGGLAVPLDIVSIMVPHVRGWMAGGAEDKHARTWIMNTAAGTPDGMRILYDAFVKLQTDLAAGDGIGVPIKTLVSIFNRMKASPRANRETAGAPGETRAERYRRLMEGTPAKTGVVP